jgi:hypothetical protein
MVPPVWPQGMSMDETEDVRQLVQADHSPEFLFARIAEFDPDSLGFQDASEAEKTAHGRNWWQQREVQIKKLVCGNKKVTSDNVRRFAKETVTLIFQAIGTEFGMSLATFVTALVLKKVIEGWCEKQ